MPTPIFFRAGTLALLFLIPSRITAQTISPNKVYDRYQQTVWQEQHGLPHNTVLGMTRTRDGYMWLGTYDGVARFDGVRFTSFGPANAPDIHGTIILSVLQDAAGVLWLATDNGGIARYADGRFTSLTRADGLVDDHPRALLEDRHGNLWIGTVAGLSCLRNGRFTNYSEKDGLTNAWVTSLAEDDQGNLWVGTLGGLMRVSNGRITVYTEQNGVALGRVQAVQWDPAGHLWVGSESGLGRWTDGHFAAGARSGLPQSPVSALHVDREGTLWVGTAESGLLRKSGDSFVSYTNADGLPSNRVASLYEDPDGDMWVGTSDGLVRLRTPRFTALTAKDGLPRDNVQSLYQDVSNQVWVASEVGLAQRSHGRFRTFTRRDGLPEDGIAAITSDRSGRLFVATREAIAVRDGDRFRAWPLPSSQPTGGLRTLLADRAGRLWVGTATAGAIVQDAATIRTYSRANGLRDDFVLSLYEDRSGAMWIGTLRGGITRIADERVTSWTTEEGLANNQVLSFYEDRDGALWIGTHGGGLSRFKHGQLATIGLGAGLFNSVVFQILEDDSGHLWMSCPKGIFRVSLKDLNEVADGTRNALTTVVAYGVADGMLSSECNQGAPGGYRMQDGKLWFPTVRGIVVVDPRQRNAHPPRVAVEGVTIDRVRVPVTDGIRIRPGQRNLEIEYTALSWSRPHQIAFRYRLTGFDATWHEAAARRTAYYSYLPPGSYTFTVIADNGEGVWNTDGASIRFSVLPAFYQTRWFQAAAVSAVAMAVIVAWRVRARQFRLAQATRQAFSRQLIESQEHERKRIAGELHDGLGQHLVVIRNLALLTLGDRTDDGDRRPLQEICGEASSALDEVRTIAYNLRPYQLDRLGLSKALEAVVNAASLVSTTTFTTMVDDVEDAVAKEREIDVYRIVQEAVNNIVKHASASEATVTAERRESSLRLTIHDNGRGFVPGAVRAEPGSGGFGLVGLSERTQLLGGRLTIVSAPGQGTTLAIDLPLLSSDATP